MPPTVDLTTAVVHPPPWAFSFVSPLMIVTVYLWRWAADRLSADDDDDDDPPISLRTHRLPLAAGVGGCLALIAGWILWCSLVQESVDSLLVIGGWIALYWYSKPAWRPAASPLRLDRPQRYQRMAKAAAWAVFPTVLTIWWIFGVVLNSGVLPSWLSLFPVEALLAAGGLLLIGSFVVRTIDRHVMRKDCRELGMGIPRAPWWPVSVAALWMLPSVVALVWINRIFWPIYQAGIAFRQAHVATYGSASTLLREVVFVVLGFGVANVLAAIIIFGVMRWLYGRQIKKRSHYDEAVTVAAYERAALPL